MKDQYAVVNISGINIPVRLTSQSRMLGATHAKLYGLGRNASLFGLSSRSLFG
ncbi:hypothetical protein G7B40_001410 [Aetokthonos hydrillicola Thurmond2011]|uniref:Uncharacterized protein n=1 Tax=Aetokthonos hydrillicola Thurmond2011 TaxID=2712845 RepID=A0AAP5I148_9CYAN|nr:hypothetical protein [Aetokthonos hydrillicola]MBO3463122.1 hypothetical protein [Aetokthonos hydrillicola CCALA 1050]MBW4591094.1 hypothetical protein [Aetokthonos hydrillicola CCALA 1050]MDR9893243.1 hypothetical protein [Aetokthonos hydrillicola Thurmond2011]